MEKILKDIKLLLYDVDNTGLCLKMYMNDKGENDKETGKRIIGIRDDEKWLEYNIMNNAYKYCEAPKPLVNLANYVISNGGKLMGLTECRNSFEYNSKYNRMKECYAGSFEHHGDLISIDTRKLKVTIIKTLAKKYNLNYNQIMFIDDSFAEVMEAGEFDIIGMHTTEALMRFYDMDNPTFDTNGVVGEYKGDE